MSFTFSRGKEGFVDCTLDEKQQELQQLPPHPLRQGIFWWIKSPDGEYTPFSCNKTIKSSINHRWSCHSIGEQLQMRFRILTGSNLESSFSFTGLTDEGSSDVTAGRSVPLDDWLPHDCFRYGLFYSSCITEVVDQYCCFAMRFDRFDINGVLDFFLYR